MKSESTNFESGKLIPSEPRLRGMDKILTILESEQLPNGEMINWKQLRERVKPYHSMMEFSDNIREAVLEYVAAKIPKFKEAIPAIDDLDDKALLDALANNWFEEIEDVEGQRREVLLAVAAHVVKRIETLTERKLLGQASQEKLGELGIDPAARDLLVDMLEIGAKSDPLFVRFLAYAQLSGKPPVEALPTGLHIPGDAAPHTFAEIFPHETRFIARRLSEVAEKDAAWKQLPGAPEFGKYIEKLSELYSCTDVRLAPSLQKETLECYAAVLATDFPVLATGATEGYYKEPYLDPELKISVSTPETKKEEKDFKGARDLMADNLDEIGAQRFSDSVKEKNVKSSIVLGGFGVNLSFSAVAQETPVNLLFLNEQIRTYDSRFVGFVEKLVDIPAGLAGRELGLEAMSRMSTMLHEFSHPIHPSDSAEGERLGRKPATVIDEVKAETLWRAVMPRMVEQGFKGTSEEWMVAMLAGSLMLVKDQPEDDPYYAAGVYCLNDLFEKGIAKFKNNKISVADTGAYYTAMKAAAMEISALYEDETMTERKAVIWIKKCCTPNPALARCIAFLKAMPN
jgi:hypothetical protein